MTARKHFNNATKSFSALPANTHDMDFLHLNTAPNLKQFHVEATVVVSFCCSVSVLASRPAPTMKAQKTSPRLRLERNVDAQLTGSFKFTEWICKSSQHNA